MQVHNQILILDERERSRILLSNFLSAFTLNIKEAASFSEAANLLQSSVETSMMLIHLNSLNESNLNSILNLKSINPGAGIVLLADIKNPNLAVSLLEKDIIDHIVNPENLAGIFSAIKNETSKRELIRKTEAFQRKLHSLTLERQKSIKQTLKLEEVHDTTLENLMTALDLRDVETFGHSRTVAKYCQVLAQILGISDKKTLINIRKGALLHDVGKIAIPDSILKKPTSLTSQEWEKIKLHPAVGFSLIKEAKEAEEVGNIILYHHERFEGTGYPKRLKKDKIPFEARVFALSDALDSITSDRPYRKRKDFKFAKKEIQSNSGTQFDPVVVDAFCSLNLSKWEKIRFETTKLFQPFESLAKMK